MWTLTLVENEQQREQARALIWAYLQWINEGAQREYGITFDIEAMVTSDLEQSEKFQPPSGRLYLAQEDSLVGGVGCLKQLRDNMGEIQRMYVRPECRGQGLGRLIAERLIADARQIGYQTVRLESLKFLQTAHHLYRSLGFKEIERYADNSMKAYQDPKILDLYQTKVVFMELTL